MSHRVLVERAIKRMKVIKNLDEHLKIIKEVIKRLDSDADVFLFGSVAEGKYNYSSDIDILVITDVEPSKVHLELWRSGIKEPFEIHVQPPERAEIYRRRARLVKI